MDDAVTLTREGALAVIRLNRPEARNSLRIADMARLAALLGELGDARCLLLTGTDEAFCAGRDLKEMQPGGNDARPVLSERVNPLLLRLRALPIPTIAALRGPALGLGLGLALACDITLAAEDARLGSPFREIGCVLDSGGHWFLAQRIGCHRAAELIFTGRLLSGREAAALGLINRAVGALQLEPLATAMAQRIASGPTAAFRASKAILAAGHDLPRTLEAEIEAQAAALDSRDGQEGLRAFLEKRAPRFIGA